MSCNSECFHVRNQFVNFADEVKMFSHVKHDETRYETLFADFVGEIIVVLIVKVKRSGQVIKNNSFERRIQSFVSIVRIFRIWKNVLARKQLKITSIVAFGR